MEHLSQFITNHWQLWLCLIVILLLIFIYEFITMKKKAKQLSPQAAVDLINHEDAVVIDIRDKENYKNGHIIDSINANVDDFDQPKMNKYKNKPLILVCAKGIQTQSLAAKISTLGYQPLVLAGGFAAWVEADLPIVKGKN